MVNARRWMAGTLILGLYWLGLAHAFKSGSLSTWEVAQRGGVSSADIGLLLVFALNLVAAGLMLYAGWSAAVDRVFPPRRLAPLRVVGLNRAISYLVAVTMLGCALGLAYLPLRWLLAVYADLRLIAP